MIDITLEIRRRLSFTTTLKLATKLNNIMNAIHPLSLSLVIATARWAQNGVTVAGGRGNGNGTNQLYYPSGLCVDEEGTVIVADCVNHRIVEWKRGATIGTLVAGGNGEGKRPDQLNRPTDVICDTETNSLFICDWGNHRVTRWSRENGTQSGETLIDSIDCWGLARDGEGSLYITVKEKHEVRCYRRGEKRGIVVAGGNGKGVGLNQLNNPLYVCLDGDQAVYISDSNNNRVMKWAKDAKEGIVVAGGRGQGTDLTQLYHPRGVLVDATGTVYVTDSWNARVIRWCRGAPQGTVLVGGNGKGEGENQFNGPIGLSFELQGHLLVADYSNNRVQRFLLENNWIKIIFFSLAVHFCLSLVRSIYIQSFELC